MLPLTVTESVVKIVSTMSRDGSPITLPTNNENLSTVLPRKRHAKFLLKHVMAVFPLPLFVKTSLASFYVSNKSFG